MMRIDTKRLYLREMNENDMDSLKAILQDTITMHAYEHAFSDEECHIWLDKQLARYQTDGFGLWAVIEKKSDCMIGQCGLSWQAVEKQPHLEIGYLFNRAYWHQGYASEAAQACKNYAFETLKQERICSIIRDNNVASQKVAKRNGMRIIQSFVKEYYGISMPHDVWSVERE